mgnify:FL=1
MQKQEFIKKDIEDNKPKTQDLNNQELDITVFFIFQFSLNAFPKKTIKTSKNSPSREVYEMLESNLKPQIIYVIAVYVYIQTNIFLQKLKQVILNDKF